MTEKPPAHQLAHGPLDQAPGKAAQDEKRALGRASPQAVHLAAVLNPAKMFRRWCL